MDPFTIVEKQMKDYKLEICLKDANGVLVERRVTTLEEGLQMISDFVSAHGGPDEENNCMGRAGTVHFRPVM